MQINHNYSAKSDPLTSVNEITKMIQSHRGEPGCALVSASRELIDWLIAKDTHNRKKTPTNVERLKGDILAGNWYVTNQGIGLTRSMFVVDGGHRLESIRQAGYPAVRFFLMFNIDDQAQAYVDRHHKRHMSDIMTLMHDATVSKRYVAILNVMIKIKANWFTGSVQDPLAISTEWEAKHWGFKPFESIKRISTLPAPVMAALIDHYVITQDPRLVEFAEQVAVGELLASGDPAFALRNWLIKTSKISGGSAIQKERYQKSMAAVEAHLEGRKITKLYASHGV
jgi:hypothetical protein